MIRGPGTGSGVALNRVHAVYVIGGNGIPMNSTVADNVISGGGSGASLKIGGTGDFGSSPISPDAADVVTASGNLIVNNPGTDPTTVLVATNSDDITLENNTIVTSTVGISLSGRYSGSGLRVTSNGVTARRFLQAKLWIDPAAASTTKPSGTSFYNVALPSEPCLVVGICVGNVAR
jgi:hypothetical protein